MGTVAAMVGRIAITATSPTVSCGQYPARAVTGEDIAVAANVFREGHDAVAADVVVTAPDGTQQPFLRMTPGAPGTDRWHATVRVPDDPSSEGTWTFGVEAWSDPLGTWWHDAPIKVEAGIDVDVMLEEGARLYERAAAGVPEADRAVVSELAAVLRDDDRAEQVERLGVPRPAQVHHQLPEGRERLRQRETDGEPAECSHGREA